MPARKRMSREERSAYQRLYRRRKKEGTVPVQNNKQRGGTAAEFLARQTQALRSIFELVKDRNYRMEGESALNLEQAQELHDWIDQSVMNTENLTEEEERKWYDRTLMEEEDEDNQEVPGGGRPGGVSDSDEDPEPTGLR
jgi:hypothetical protein